QVREAMDQRAAAEEELKQVKEKSRSEIRPLLAKRAQWEAEYQKVKADFDSVNSLYNLAVEKRDEAADSERRKTLQDAVDQRKKEVDELEKKLVEAQNSLDKT